MRPIFATLVLALAGLAMPVHSQSAQSQNPVPRPPAVSQATAATRALNADPAAMSGTVVSEAGFQAWLVDFRPRGRAAGIKDRTMDAAFAGIHYDPAIIRLDSNQSEFSKQMWEYLDGAVSTSRIQNGQAALVTYNDALNRIERKYGVDKEVVVAIWGMESSYGANRGNSDVIQSLATLAYHGRRQAMFEDQLIAALKIVQAGDVSPRGMRGSWAGAMGHTQFMPTSYLAHAVDFTGDGKRDIWSNNPTDALASTAAYLKDAGWKKDRPWGIEVRLPRGFNYAVAGHGSERSVSDWTRLGVRDMAGQKVPNFGKATILLPAGARGPAFMMFGNFEAIRAYNASDAYAIAVGHLSDRLRGQPGFVAGWPRGDRALASTEKMELQKRLTAMGFNTQGTDGKIGPKTVDAIRQYQVAAGLVPDGYASEALLISLRN